jgi:hypothetical protein
MENENQDALLKQLLKQVSELSGKVQELETLKRDLPTSAQLYQQLNPQSGSLFNISPFPEKLKRGRGSRPPLESDILAAQDKSRSASETARTLNICYTTYKKYAKLYGVFEKKINKTAKGIPKTPNPNKGKYPLNDILAGKYPDYPIFRLKDKLIRAKTKPMACEQCGFCERRITDGKIPLLLVFEDGNSKNHKLENMKLFCYNCSFTSGKIWSRFTDRSKWLNNPDRILGASRDTKQIC